MGKTAELGSWVGQYFEGHPADYFEKKVLVPLREKNAYIESKEGGFVVRDDEGRRFIYSQVESPRIGLVTRMSLEWELPYGGTFKPFRLEIVEKEGNEDGVALRIQVLKPRLSNHSGVFLHYENNKWISEGGIWYDRSDNLRNWPAIMRDDVPVSNRFEYCVPVDMGVTIPLWLMKLEDGDFSMPIIVPARTVPVDGFEWRAPYEESGSTFFPENTLRLSGFSIHGGMDQEEWGKIFHRVLMIETAMRVRFLQERI